MQAIETSNMLEHLFLCSINSPITDIHMTRSILYIRKNDYEYIIDTMCKYFQTVSTYSTTSIVPYLACGMISWVFVMESWAYSVTNRFYCLTYVTSRDRTFTKWKFIWSTMLQPQNLRHVKLHYLLYTSHEDHHIK